MRWRRVGIIGASARPEPAAPVEQPLRRQDAPFEHGRQDEGEGDEKVMGEGDEAAVLAIVRRPPHQYAGRDQPNRQTGASGSSQ
jgi:hypothetical protein